MGDATSRALRVALIADREIQGKHLRELLETNGLAVVVDRAIQEYSPEQVSTDEVDVLLVNLDEGTSHDMERLEALIEHSAVPILFNEGGIPGGSGWGRKLIAKLNGLVQGRQATVRRAPAETETEQPDAPAPATLQRQPQEVVGVAEVQAETQPETLPEMPAEVLPETAVADAALAAASGDAAETDMQRPALRVVHQNRPQSTAPAQTVWILGASLGGPQAVKLFLSRLPGDLPIGFVLAQHIGKPFVPLLAEQLGRVTEMTVMPAQHGRSIRAREVILVPVDSRFCLTDAGVVELRDEPVRGPYRPCIDEVMEEVARCYGDKAHAMVFSGMGDDGALGATTVSQTGGTVWAQEANSCVISSMPDATRKRGVVSYSGSPEELAAHLAEQTRLQMAGH